MDDDNIRLIKVLPGVPLRFGLHYFKFLSSPKQFYNALSYTWGSEVDRAAISVNGRRLMVTRNLLEALSHLSRSFFYTYLWVDAICIDQSNLAEKSIQVANMNRIYQHATEVIAFLGAPSDQMAVRRSRLAYERLKKFATERRRIVAACEDDLTLAHSLSQFSRNSHELAPYINGYYRDSVWESIVRLYLLPWWSRAWIVQEACCGPKPMICYGNIMMHFSVFEHLLDHFELGRMEMDESGQFEPTHPPLTSARRLMTMRGRREDGNPSFLEIIYMLSHQQCKDPRDKVYAAISLVDTHRKIIVPDYQKSVLEVYLDVVQYCLQNSNHPCGTLDFLGYASSSSSRELLRLSSSSRTSIPGWIPDWRADSDYLTLGNNLRKRPDLHCHLDEIAWAPSVSSEYMRLTLKGWAMYQVGQSLAELYQQASSDIQREMLTTQLCSLFDYIIDIFLSGFNQVSDETNRHFMDHIQAIDVVTPYTRERSIRTIQGDTVELGLFPDSTRAGDILCSFLGGSVFYVIRQVGNGIYKFIGEAVLMGQMDKIEREGSLESFILM